MSNRISLFTLVVVLMLSFVATSVGQAREEKKARMLVFSSKDCGPCQEAQPTVDAVITQCKKRDVVIQEYDLSKPGTEFLAAKYRLIGTPTFVFLDKNGNEVARLLGKQSENALKQALSAVLGEPCPGLQLFQPKKKTGEKKPPKKPMKTK